MSRPLWFVHLLRKAFPSRFIAAKATHLPILGTLVNRWLFEGDDLFYLPSDKVLQIHETITKPTEVVLPSQVVEHFIKRASVHWIMDSCICRKAQACVEYSTDLGCLFLGEAALGINPDLGRRVTKREALDHVQRCREEGLIHLIGRNKLDTVWLGVAPGYKLLTVCNCCPCCCLWRVLPHVSATISAKITRMPGVEVVVGAQCVGCGTCVQEGCFVQAIHLEAGRAIIGEACRGCGRCVPICPEGAIELIVEGDAIIMRAIERIAPLVELS
jgi:ferredoxin